MNGKVRKNLYNQFNIAVRFVLVVATIATIFGAQPTMVLAQGPEPEKPIWLIPQPEWQTPTEQPKAEAQREIAYTTVAPAGTEIVTEGIVGILDERTGYSHETLFNEYFSVSGNPGQAVGWSNLGSTCPAGTINLIQSSSQGGNYYEVGHCGDWLRGPTINLPDHINAIVDQEPIHFSLKYASIPPVDGSVDNSKVEIYLLVDNDGANIKLGELNAASTSFL